MSTESQFHEPIEQYFLAEASDLLQTIEQTLLDLLEEKTTEKVHTLMRSAHTLKGSAANCQLKTIEIIAHHLEDVFQALYPPELQIDRELGSLLLEGYDCLKTPLNATLSNLPYDEEEILDRTAAVFAKLQNQLGDFFGREAPLPTSEELGFDVVGLIFADSIPQDLQQLETTIASQDPKQIQSVLHTQAKFFQELGVTYKLPGLVSIAQAILTAIEENPQEIMTIAPAALENLQQACAAILAGERTQGGTLSDKLSHWIETSQATDTDTNITLTSSSESKSVTEKEGQTSVGESSDADISSPSSLTEELLAMVDNFESEEKTSVSATSNSAPSAPVTPSRDLSTSNSSLATSPVEKILGSIFAGDWETSVPIAEHKKSPDLELYSKSQSAETLPTVRVAVAQLDRLSQTIGELLISENQQNLQSDKINHLTKDIFQQFLQSQQQLNRIRNWSDQSLLLSEKKQKQHQKQTNRQKSSLISNSVSELQAEFDALEMDVYSELHLLIQSLTEQMKHLGEHIEALEGFAQDFRFNLRKRKQLLSGAQEDLLEARMVPLATVLNRFPRILQQMIAAHQKPAELKLLDTNILVDKIFVEKLYEPLLHLIRNAYDHGLESVDIRRQQGKSKTGHITVRAYHQGNRTTIEVKDDGQGLNWELIRAKAIEKQLLTSEQAASASEAQLAELLFEPGFSTIEKVSQLSGRGIGLDVVRSQLQALQGSISVNSVLGQGTTFVLQFPLNFTTASILICESEGIVYGFLGKAIEQVLLPEPEQIQHQQSSIGKKQQTFLCWGEKPDQQLIPVYPLTDLINYHYPTFLNHESTSLSLFPLKAKNSVKPLLMLKHNQQQLCLQIDRILVEQELVIKPFSNTLNLPNYIQGYSVLGDGSLTLVIDLAVLVTQTRETNLKANSPLRKLSSQLPSTLKNVATIEQEPLTLPAIDEEIEVARVSPLRRSIQVLVVDDSVVQRQVLRQNLTEAGYQVLEAENGQEALVQLNQHSDIQLIICDIEMPHMNGFEFLSHWRQYPRFSEIPVIMLTTRSGEKHRHLALALGAKLYITKPYSNQHLLEVIAQLTQKPQDFIETTTIET